VKGIDNNVKYRALTSERSVEVLKVDVHIRGKATSAITDSPNSYRSDSLITGK